MIEELANIPVPSTTTKIVMLLGKQPKGQESRRLIIKAYKPGNKPKEKPKEVAP
jgi:hypothetical protein